MNLIKKLNWKIVTLIVIAAGAFGIFLSFGPPQLIARTETPIFCSSCHVMQSQFEAWFHVGAQEIFWRCAFVWC